MTALLSVEVGPFYVDWARQRVPYRKSRRHDVNEKQTPRLC